jgi:hypothetical protein
VVGTAVPLDELHPPQREALERLDLRRLDLVAKVAGDH